MDRRLLYHYNNELQHLREMGAEFAREFPKIAGRLSLEKGGNEICPDPFVERLLEGFAFLTARIHLKLDAEFPRFTQSMLETIYPHYLSPTPSMAIVRFQPDEQMAQPDGYAIPRNTSLRANIGRGERTACEYRTAHDVQLWPIQITEARYYTRDVSELNLPSNASGRAAIRIRLRTTGGLPFNKMHLDRLTFFLRGADQVPGSIYEQIFASCSAVIVQAVNNARVKPRVVLLPATIRQVGFEEAEALLPYGPRSFQGYRLLREYFAFPERFLFVGLTGLAEGVHLCESDMADIILVLKEQEVRLEGHVSAASFELFCTPVINLFSKRTDRISLLDRFSEFHVVPDRTRPLDFEVFQVETVTGYGSRSEEEQEFRPFYLAKDGGETGAFFTVNRVPRVLSEREKKFGKASSYSGTEVNLSLVDAQAAPYRTDLQQLGVTALCTNRHLPIQMAVGVGATDFSMELNAPVASVRCLSGPTPPRPPYAEGEIAWRTISHLSLNYLSLLDVPGEEGAVALRELLKLYADATDPLIKKQIEGVRSAQSLPIVRRVPTNGPIAFARGLEISVLFDETAFEGAGMFVLGAVLEKFFARYVSLNSFTETVIKSQQRGEIIRWRQRLGQRHLT